MINFKKGSLSVHAKYIRMGMQNYGRGVPRGGPLINQMQNQLSKNLMIRKLCYPQALFLPRMTLLNPNNWNAISPFCFHVQLQLFSSKVPNGTGEAANE